VGIPDKRHKAVVRFLDGTLRKGWFVRMDEPPDHNIVMLDLEEILFKVPLRNIKAVFFVRSWEGDSNYYNPQGYNLQNDRLNRLWVEFTDGEVLWGRSMNYCMESPGFFLFPANTDANNRTVLINKLAVGRIVVGDDSGSKNGI
jgi:hypothetical protein